MSEDQAFRIIACIDYDIAKEWQLDLPDRLLNVANEIAAIVRETSNE